MYLLLAFIVYMVLIKVYWKLTDGFCQSKARLDGKVALVTGGNSGIGYETSKELARRGAKVIVASFEDKAGREAVKNIINETGNKNVVFKYLDLRSFKNIREFAADVKNTEKELHVLVNNAGMFPVLSLTEDGLNTGMQVNYYGHFLLTILLLPLLKTSSPSRVINVTSLLFLFGRIDNRTKFPESILEVGRIYCNSKLYQYLFTKELAKRLDGTGVTVNAGHPGVVKTPIFSPNPKAILKYLIALLVNMYGKTPWEGAQTSIYLSVEPSVEKVTGQHFGDCHTTAWINPLMNYQKLQGKLFEKSKKVVGLTKEDTLDCEEVN